jgi:hypothetical protein
MSDYDSRDNESPDYLAGYAQGQVDALRPLLALDMTCENYYGGQTDCTNVGGRSFDAEYGADQYCWPCRIRTAAVGVPEAVAQDNETEPQPPRRSRGKHPLDCPLPCHRGHPGCIVHPHAHPDERVGEPPPDRGLVVRNLRAIRSGADT